MRAYDAAKRYGVIIIGEPLGKIEGYYNEVNGQKFIHVNSELAEWYQKFVVAHELYFAINDIPNKFIIKDHYEIDPEAKKFAADLLMKDEEGTFEEICRKYEIPEEKIIILKRRYEEILKHGEN